MIDRRKIYLIAFMLFSYTYGNAQSKIVTDIKKISGCWNGIYPYNNDTLTIIINSKSIVINHREQNSYNKFKKTGGKITFKVGVENYAYLVLGDGDSTLFFRYVKEPKSKSRPIFMVIPFKKCNSILVQKSK